MIRFDRDLATGAGMVGKDISVKKYVVRLNTGEREHLQALIRKGKSPAKRLLKARILLKADVSEAGEGWSDSRIIQALDTSASMVYRVRKQLVEEGFEAVLSRKRRMTPPVAAIFDGEKEAKLIALACSKPPKGRARWTLRLLESKVVELRYCRARKRLNDRTHTQKNCLKPHRRQCWVIPPKANSAFVAAMEDVLAVYTRPHNADYPLVCLDETSKQLIAETRTPIPMKRGRAARIDYEYERNGTANLFMLFAPLEGWRHVEVTDRDTAVDYAHVLKDLADRHFPHAKTIVLVQDNLNIHSKASLYEAFPAAEAACHHRPRVDAEVERERHAGAPAPTHIEARRPFDHGERRPERSLGVVLMRVRRTEQCEQGVADEFVDEAAELFHRGGQFFEQLVLKHLHDLGVELFGEGRETAEVGEQDSDGAPVGLASKDRCGGRGGEPGRALRRRRRVQWRLDRLGRCALFQPTFGAEREIGRADITTAGAAGGLACATFRAKRKLCLNDETATDAVHRFVLLQITNSSV